MQLASTAGVYPASAIPTGGKRWGPGVPVVTATPWVNALYPLDPQPRLGEEWEPGVFSVEFDFDAAPGIGLEVVLFQNATLIPGGSADPGGTPLARIVLPDQATPGVMIENVAQPMGNLKSGDTLAVLITQPADPAWELNFKASVQGKVHRPNITGRRVLT